MIHFADIFEGIEQIEEDVKDLLTLFTDTDGLSLVEEGLILGYLNVWGDANVFQKNWIYGLGWL